MNMALCWSGSLAEGLAHRSSSSGMEVPPPVATSTREMPARTTRPSTRSTGGATRLTAAGSPTSGPMPAARTSRTPSPAGRKPTAEPRALARLRASDWDTPGSYPRPHRAIWSRAAATRTATASTRATVAMSDRRRNTPRERQPARQHGGDADPGHPDGGGDRERRGDARPPLAQGAGADQDGAGDG